MTDSLTHPGQLCASGDRAVDLALELGRARVRLAAYQAQEARIRALLPDRPGLDHLLYQFVNPRMLREILDEPEAPT